MDQLDYLISMYPFEVKRIQRYVWEACDRMKYRNSPIYDEYPERAMIDRMCRSICETILSEEKRDFPEVWKEEKRNLMEKEEDSLKKEEMRLQIVEEEDLGGQKGADLQTAEIGPEPLRKRPSSKCPPQGQAGFGLDDMVRVLLLNEIYHRR